MFIKKKINNKKKKKVCTVNFYVKCLIWTVFANGDFDTKSAYNLSKDTGEIKESLFNS